MTFIAPLRRVSAATLLVSLFALTPHAGAAPAPACEYRQLVNLPIRYTGPSLSPTRQRTCQAQLFIAERHRIAGDGERAKAVMGQATDCKTTPGNLTQEPT